MIRLLLVRHGETAWNEQRLLQGQQDHPLSLTGERQVRTLVPLVRRHAPARLISSPLMRARQTAGLLGGPTATSDPRWKEAYLGDWEGLSSLDLARESPRDYHAWREGRLTPPSAETFGELQARSVEGALDAVETAREAAHSTVVVVTHGGPVRALCSALTGLDPARAVPVGPASVTILDFVGTAARLRAYNLSAELGMLDPPD